MHYFHNKEESAEILRRALQMMAPHEAGFHPLSYAVWYEHAADLNPGLSRDLEKIIAAESVLAETDVARLYALHIAARDVEAFERAQSQLRTLLEDTATGADSAQTAAVQFTRSLEGLFGELEQPADPVALKRVVAELLSQAQSMHLVTSEFSEKLATNRAEVVSVIERLERAQTEPLRDPLTGINNRHGFQRAADALGTSLSNLTGVALLAADIDHFKKINDTHGHVIGDKVLLKIAEILRTHIRAQDTPSRLGGDEFAVLLPGISLSAAAALAEQIRTSVARTLISRLDGVEYVGQVSLSIGLAMGEEDDTLESLRHRADAAMYKAKDAGRNRIGLAAQRAPTAAGAHSGQ
ncbi:MAG: Diguanylate cyclase VdcA [Gammaproteobacteria bacterium]|nr:Diguanylate cyclase VdcA [Gammaproteobacteria bacterium]